MRTISIEEAFNLIQGVYAKFGWNPDSTSSREQRNHWFASAVAVVHYGHATLNPAGGDPRWCLKDAGGGRPQSDDIIVDSATRAYFDLMPNAGGAWSWNLGRHGEPLPGGQNVYPPARASLPGGTGQVPTPVDPPIPPQDDTARLILQALGNMHAKLDAILAEQRATRQAVAEMLSFADADTLKIGGWMVEQAQGVVASVIGDLGPQIAAIKDAQCVLKQLRR